MGDRMVRKPSIITRIEQETGLTLHQGRNPGYTLAGGEVDSVSLDHQNLRRFPESLKGATFTISLTGNSLTEIPADLGVGKTRNDIWLTANKIESIPIECTDWDRPPVWQHSGGAWCIYLHDNPLRNPPPEVLERGIEALRSWFGAQRRAADETRDVRLLVIGDGGAGKTSLVRRLVESGFDLHEGQTEGIDISVWHLPEPGRPINVHVWDFGGQEIMHSTHQFFLSHRSLYIVVLDGRRNENAEYWLQHVKSFGGDSPVIVVMNKIDENPSFDVNRPFLQEKYPNIAGFQRISCQTQVGVAELGEAIKSAISSVDALSLPWPESWLAVRRALETESVNYMDQDTYTEICRSAGVSDAEEQEHLAELLHDLGLVVHFPDLNLSDLHVLNPTWVTQGVYQVIHAPELAASGGLLELSSIPGLFSTDPAIVYNPRTSRYLVELMTKFELCYTINDGRRLLFPELLSLQQPPLADYAWDDGAHHIIEYGFLPRSVFPRLMVRLHRDMVEGLVWRSGMVLRNERFASRALVRVDHEDRRLEIKVAGEHTREHLAVIRYVLAEIHDSFEELKVTELVPCLCQECRKGRRVHYYSLESLLRRLEHGKKTVECELSVEEVRLERLLWGLQSKSRRADDAWTVFISYSRKDFEIVQELALDLRQRGISYWLDAERMRPGDSVSKEIERGLEAPVILACLSRNQMESNWSRIEWAGALTRKLIIPFILDDLDIADVPATMRDLLAVRRQDRSAYSSLLDHLVELSSKKD